MQDLDFLLSARDLAKLSSNPLSAFCLGLSEYEEQQNKVAQLPDSWRGPKPVVWAFGACVRERGSDHGRWERSTSTLKRSKVRKILIV